MNEQSIFATGRFWARRLWGTARFDRAERALVATHPCLRDIGLLAWSLFDRPHLEPRVRSLCLCAALATLDSQDELRHHVFGALSNGATTEEVVEALMHVTPYIGVPRGRAALVTAHQCFEQFRPVSDKPEALHVEPPRDA